MQNIAILAGNIGQDPETRSTQDGKKITHFTLATSRPRYSEGRVLRDENGYRVQDTEWHRITCFYGVGKTVQEHCSKGMKVLAGMAVGPMVAGTVHDLTGSYDMLETIAAPVVLVAALLFVGLGPYPVFARADDASPFE